MHPLRIAALPCIVCALVISQPACNSAMLQVAQEAQGRADAVQREVVDKQHGAICVLLFRDMLQRIETQTGFSNDELRTAMNDIWNERDVAEHWLVQNERAAALRMAAVDVPILGRPSWSEALGRQVVRELGNARAGAAAGAAEAIYGPKPTANPTSGPTIDVPPQ
jgi:hypothetical protein